MQYGLKLNFFHSSVATGARVPQPQFGRVMGIAEIRWEKIGGMAGWGTGSFWPSIMVNNYVL